jgi:hypothetical protein
MKAEIYRNPLKRTVDILFYYDQNGKRYIAKPVKLIFEELKEGVEIEPTLRIDRFMERDFLIALAEALQQEGIDTHREAKIEGLLEATKYHLEDLRKLLKLNRKK